MSEENFKPSAPKRKRFSPQMKLKVKYYQNGKCVDCGEPRGESPYKFRCLACAGEQRDKLRKKLGFRPWSPGGRGRKPKVSSKSFVVSSEDHSLPTMVNQQEKEVKVNSIGEK